jgi:thiosulfate/3-mercaptopyruvate sulfurtransferase
VLVDTEWLAERLRDPAVATVDMRWREDGSARDRFDQGHIPGATYLDWSTDLVDPDAPIAFLLAPPERFRQALEQRGIGDDTRVVAYADRHGSGPTRLWWGARVYGHDQVVVLDGGLEKWVAEGRAMESGPPPPARSARWTPRRSSGLVASAADVERGREDPRVVVLDSRPPDQFRGASVWFETGPVPADPDGVARTPRGEFRAGRVPWARSVPATVLYRDDGRFRRPAELRALFAEVGVTPGTTAVAYCGVGISASAVVFALALAGIEEARLYDASWEEWGRDPSRPVTRG